VQHGLTVSLSDFRRLLKSENRFFPDCSGVVTARVFVTVNLLIERFEKSVYYYLYLLIHASILTLNSLLQLMSDPLPGWRLGPASQ